MTDKLASPYPPEKKTAADPVTLESSAPSTNTNCEHTVQFYENDAFLVDRVCAFISAGVKSGDGAILIGTPSHRSAIEQQLSRQTGIDLAQLKKGHRYFSLDAKETLSQFMV